MSQSSAMLPIKQTEISVGKALPWSIYDENGTLLLASGSIVESQSQLESLVRHGYAFDSLWDTVVPSAHAATPAAAPKSPVAKVQEEHKDTLIELDSVRWAVGELLHMQVHDDPAARFTVRMIGFVKNKSVHITAPMVDGKLASIREGQTFILRAFPGKKAYAFTCSVLKCVYSPYPYLHLSYPRQVKCAVIRKGVRANVKIIAALSIGAPERQIAVTLCDLSMGGAACIIKTIIGAKGEMAVVKFKVNAAGQDEFLTLRCTLRSIATNEGGDGYRHGFEFLDISTQEKLVLSAFVHQTLAEAD